MFSCQQIIYLEILGPPNEGRCAWEWSQMLKSELKDSVSCLSDFQMLDPAKAGPSQATWTFELYEEINSLGLKK